MAEPAQFLQRSTARQWVEETIDGLTFPASAAASGTYQNPAKSRLKALAANLLAGQGLTRASHLLALLSAVEDVRSAQYTTASAGSWEAPELNLRRRSSALLPRATDLVRPTTARTVIDLMKLATFS